MIFVNTASYHFLYDRGAGKRIGILNITVKEVLVEQIWYQNLLKF